MVHTPWAEFALNREFSDLEPGLSESMKRKEERAFDVQNTPAERCELKFCVLGSYDQDQASEKSRTHRSSSCSRKDGGAGRDSPYDAGCSTAAS